MSVYSHLNFFLLHKGRLEVSSLATNATGVNSVGRRK